MNNSRVERRIPFEFAAVGIFLLACVAAGGYVIHGNVDMLQSEYQINQFLVDHLTLHSVFDPIAKAINMLFAPIGAFAVIVVLALLVWRIHRSFLAGLRYGVLAGSGWLVAQAFKMALPEGRPQFEGFSVGRWLIEEPGKDAFPSGHTTCITAIVVATLFVAISRWAKVVWAILGVILIAVVGLSRLYLGVHYLSDVVGAILVAIGMVFFMAWLWDVVIGRRMRVSA